MKFRSKPQTIEAIQWTGNNNDEVIAFSATGVLGAPHCVRRPSDGAMLLYAGVAGAQGWMPVPVGHWIVRRPDDHTDYWPLDPDYFAEKYDQAD